MGSFSAVHWAIVIVLALLTALALRGLWRMLVPPDTPAGKKLLRDAAAGNP